MPKAKPPSPRERETQLLNELGSHGLAAIGLLLNLFRAMQKKGIFSTIELAAIFDATAEQARGSGDPADAQLSESVRAIIRDLENQVIGRPASGVSH